MTEISYHTEDERSVRRRKSVRKFRAGCATAAMVQRESPVERCESHDRPVIVVALAGGVKYNGRL
jgi:hypothetical protein